jgi:hypothetical protein
MRLVIPEILFDIATPPLLFKGLHRRRFSTDHTPSFFVILAPHHGHMDRAIPLLGKVDTVPEACLPWSQRQALHFAAALPMALQPKTPFDANAPGPPQPCKMFQAMRVGKPTIRRQDDRTPPGQPCSHLIQHILVEVIGHTAAGMFEDFPHQRHGSATLDERQAHHTVGMPQG